MALATRGTRRRLLRQDRGPAAMPVHRRRTGPATMVTGAGADGTTDDEGWIR